MGFVGITANIAFNSIFVDCSSAAISQNPSSITAKTFDLNELNKNLQALSWIVTNLPNCPAITYEILNFPSLAAADATVFTISSDSMYASTSDNSKLGVYQLQIRGSSGNQVNSLSNDFQVTISNDCPNIAV